MLLFLLFFSSVVSAQSVSVGTYVPYAFWAQNSMEGSTQKFDINPLLSVSTTFRLSQKNFIVPELGVVHHTDRADESKVRTFFFLYQMGFRASEHFMLRYGIGTFITRISGDGEALTRNNGEGTSVYYSADESVSTYTTTFNLGGEYRFNRQWAAKLDTFIMGALSSEKRKVSYTLAAVYYW